MRTAIDLARKTLVGEEAVFWPSLYLYNILVDGSADALPGVRHAWLGCDYLRTQTKLVGARRPVRLAKGTASWQGSGTNRLSSRQSHRRAAE